MQIRRPPRVVVLIGSLAVLAAWIVIDSKTSTVPAVAPTSASGAGSREAAGTGASTAAAVRQEIPARAALRKFVSDPFSPHSWLPNLRKTEAAPPPAPVAPPLPFRFAGQYLLGAEMQVFLGKGDDVFPVKAGDTLEGQYNVESITDTEVTFVHLATGTRQTIEFGPPLKDTDVAARSGPTRAVQAAPPLRAAPAPPLSKPAAAESAPATSPGTPAQQLNQPAQLRWEGPPSTRTGTSFSVTLRLTSGEHIRSAPMQLRFDPALLEAISVRPGKYFGADAAGNFGYRVNSDGSIFVGASKRDSAPAADAELLVLTFKPIRPAASAEISLASLNLQGAAGRAIAYSSVSPFKTTITP